MSVKYTQAPISETICGVIFNSNILLNESFIFQLLVDLQKSYPIINTHPISGEEDVINGLLQITSNFEKSGFSTYRLTSLDGKWQIILQQDLLTLSWVRKDTEDVGSYPGFTNIFDRFLSLYELIRIKIIDIEAKIKSYYLCYVDRVNLEEHKETGFTLFDIIKISIPSFSLNNKEYVSNNFFNRYSTFCDEINGYCISSVNTPTLPIGQLLIIDNKIKGFNQDGIKKWFDKAHEIQLSFFEKIFSEKILNHWK